MMVPNSTCRPPNPAPSQKSFHGTLHAGGAKIAMTPSARKHRPITGTTGTENAPPVTTPVPYSISHTPGMAGTAPARHKTNVRAAPAISGGTKLNTNLRAGADHMGNPAFDAFRHIAKIPMATASAPSIIHTPSHALTEVVRVAIRLAAIAVHPITTPPHPGTAVKDPARSIVSRM